ncbi:hypothetical protein [Candidatus Binatus soli]|uniref:hypothetical protein n=1 Tax=Candidatus Binatus soli TaxID=1953413 RepID=UPI003D138B92
MGLIHHRHSGGNYPHAHHHDAADKSHHHDHEHHNASHDSHGHGDHAYDVHGNEAAIVVSDPHRLEHWHFDRPFERVAIAANRDVGNDSSPTVVVVANHDLNRLPLAARPPPALI